MELEPCYLCILQRVFVMATGAIALIAGLHNPGMLGVRVYSALTTLTALSGSFFSGKQLWLQGLPEDQVPECGVSVDYLFEVHSFGNALAELLKGDGNCADVQWVFLGLSIPGWTFIAFIGLAGLAVWQMLRRPTVSN